MLKHLAMIGLFLLAWTVPAHAEDDAAPRVVRASPEPQRKFELGLSVLPLGFGRFTSVPGGVKTTEDAAFGYGVNVSAGLRVLKGLTIGLAPQLLLNVKPKTAGGDAYREIDVLARIAYTLGVVDTISLYGEALPGYSFLIAADGSTARGPVVAFGAGGRLDLGARAFATVGAGYQVGFQKATFDGITQDTRTSFVRFTVGGGTRF